MMTVDGPQGQPVRFRNKAQTLFMNDFVLEPSLTFTCPQMTATESLARIGTKLLVKSIQEFLCSAISGIDRVTRTISAENQTDAENSASHRSTRPGSSRKSTA